MSVESFYVMMVIVTIITVIVTMIFIYFVLINLSNRQNFLFNHNFVIRNNPANIKAFDLLLSHLSFKERVVLKWTGKIVFVNKTSNNEYIIDTRGSSYNITCVYYNPTYSTKLGTNYCLTTNHTVNAPFYDIILSQYLMIKYYEKEFLSIANIGTTSHYR